MSELLEETTKRGLEKKSGVLNNRANYPSRSSYLESAPFFLSIIAGGAIMGICMKDISSRIFGGVLIAGGFGALYAEGYSPLKIAKNVCEAVGALVCLPYNLAKKSYQRYRGNSRNKNTESKENNGTRASDSGTKDSGLENLAV